MEPIHESHKASEEEEDVISKMPENVITNILDRLPIQAAVRTGILSTNWRLNWNMLTQVVFDEKFFEKSNQNERNIISRILFQLKGPVTKFVLRIPYDKTLNVEELGLWLLFLSRKGIKDVTLINLRKTPIKLPSHLFSCLELTNLSLHNCSFHPPPSFRCFPNLLSLRLILVRFESYKCGEFITRCPLLQNLFIANCILFGRVKLAQIAKLKHLLFLFLSLSTLEITTPVTTFSIFQLVGFFPKLEMLYLDFKKCKFLAEADFGNDVMASIVSEMICCSPNLQTLKIVALSENHAPPPAICSSALDFKTMGQLQLRSVVFERLRGSENEICFIKSLLACFPLLKMMRIELNSSSKVGGADGKFMFAKKLLNLYRASAVAKIDLL